MDVASPCIVPQLKCDTDDEAAEMVTTPASPTIALPSSERRHGHQSMPITKKVSGFVRRFRSIVINAQVFLAQKEMSPSDFYYFKIDLTALPMLTKYKKLRFLKKKRKKIIRAKSIQEIFDILDPYWDYVNYSLLEHIVKKYCNEEIRKQMKKYINKLHRFEKITSVKALTSALSSNRVPPSEHKSMNATLQIDATECSLYHARKVWESIAEKASLQPYVALLQGLHASLVVVTISYPRKVHKRVKQSLNKQFLQDIGIVPESVRFDTVYIPRHRPLHIPNVWNSPLLLSRHNQCSQQLDPPLDLPTCTGSRFHIDELDQSPPPFHRCSSFVATVNSRQNSPHSLRRFRYRYSSFNSLDSKIAYGLSRCSRRFRLSTCSSVDSVVFESTLISRLPCKLSHPAYATV